MIKHIEFAGGSITITKVEPIMFENIAPGKGHHPVQNEDWYYFSITDNRTGGGPTYLYDKASLLKIAECIQEAIIQPRIKHIHATTHEDV